MMASITVRNLEDGLKRRLRIRAAENGRSMEQEARDILREALQRETAPTKGLGTAINERFKRLGGVWRFLLGNRCANRPSSAELQSDVRSRYKRRLGANAGPSPA